METNEAGLLTLAEVAGQLRVCLKTARQLARSGRLPVIQVGRRLRVAPDQLAAWIERGGAVPKRRRR